MPKSPPPWEHRPGVQLTDEDLYLLNRAMAVLKERRLIPQPETMPAFIRRISLERAQQIIDNPPPAKASPRRRVK